MARVDHRWLLGLTALALVPACSGGGGGGAVRSWTAAELVESDDVASAAHPRVVVAPDGAATVVWLQHDGTRESLWARRHAPGTGWAPAELIETSDDNASAARLAVDGAGNIIAAWEQIDGGESSIWWNRFVPGIGWGTAAVLETSGELATSLVLAGNAKGDAVAVWTQFDTVRTNLWARIFTVPGGWGTAELVESSTEGVSIPAVVVDVAGVATAVWQQHDGTRANLWGNRFDPSGGWGTPGLVEIDNSGGVNGPCLVVDPAGIVTAIWVQFDGSQDSLRSSRFVAGTGWGGAELVMANSPSLAYQVAAVDPAGNVTVVWMQPDGLVSSVWANRYVPGTGWGAAGAIESDNATGVSSPDLATDATGNVLVVWVQSETPSNMRVNRFVPGAGWGTPQLLETAAGDATTTYDIAMNPEGRAMAVWPQSDGTRNNIWSARFE